MSAIGFEDDRRSRIQDIDLKVFGHPFLLSINWDWISKIVYLQSFFISPDVSNQQSCSFVKANAVVRRILDLEHQLHQPSLADPLAEVCIGNQLITESYTFWPIREVIAIATVAGGWAYWIGPCFVAHSFVDGNVVALAIASSARPPDSSACEDVADSGEGSSILKGITTDEKLKNILCTSLFWKMTKNCISVSKLGNYNLYSVLFFTTKHHFDSIKLVQDIGFQNSPTR